MPPITNNPASIGRWEVLPQECPINPVHAALMYTNKVLFVAGSGNRPEDVNEPKGSAVWDSKTGDFFRPLTPLDGDGKPFDFFCGGQTFLANGNLLFAGGTLKYDPFCGLSAAFTFSPRTQNWTTVQSMAHGRWYPTLVTLPGDRRVLVVSGSDENGNLNTFPEIYTPSRGWTAFSQQSSRLPMYAHLFLLNDGRIFYSGAQFRANNRLLPSILTLPTDLTKPMTEKQVNGFQDIDYGDQAASVLLPPAQDQKVMIIGGGDGRRLVDGRPNPNRGKTTKRVNIVDLKSANPTYRSAAPLNFPRMHVGAVLLPDRTVFVCGGSQMNESRTQTTLQAEIYNPVTNTWTVAATASVARLYHSVALLLPDGRVLTAGGNPTRSIQEKRLEIYSPPYLFKGPRPVIQNVPEIVAYGQTIQIETSQPQNIQWVSLIRPGATTHSCDTEQRLVDLPITSKTSTLLNVKVTNSENLAPRGWYMLFITDRNGVPSVAKWVRLLP